jgi:hypothetical protein
MFARTAVAVAALVVLSGTTKPSVTPQLDIIATDYAFSVPGGANASVPAGPVTLHLVNHGKELHMVGVVWLADTTAAQFVEKVSQKGFAGVEVGGVNGVAPGESATSTVILKPGNAVVVCWVVSPDGKAHVLKGMFAPIRVVPNPNAPAAEPRTAFDIALRDYAITVPNNLRAGPHVFRVENDGKVDHDIELFRLSPGADTTDAMLWVDKPNVGSPRAHPLGGIVGEDPGLYSFFDANLTPGDYMVLCWMPDTKTGVPHFYGHHMWTRFHVAA